jgi:hypothetical protein
MRTRLNSAPVLIVVGYLLLAGIAGCGGKPPAAAARDPWPQLVDQWIESDMKANPSFAAYQGRHEYDGLLPDWSAAGLQAETRRLKEWRARVAATDASKLVEAQRFEREHLLAVIDERLFWQDSADWPHRNPEWYYLDPNFYLDRPYADIETRMKAYTRWASNVPAAAAQIEANLQGPLPKTFIDIGAYTFGPLGKFLQDDVVKVFTGVGDAQAQAEFLKQNAAAAEALAALDRHLTALRATQTAQFAIGAELFAKMLHDTERVDTPLAVLEKMGQEDLERNLKSLADACAVFAPRRTVRQCVQKANDSKPPGGNAVQYASELLDGLKRFVQEKQIVSIPGTEEAKVKQAPPYNSQNSVYIDIPGPYEKNMPSYVNVAAPDPSWSKQKQRAYLQGKADMLFTAVHEVWPGHFLQYMHANRSKSMISRLYVGYAFGEGWAHYAEEMMWEEGLGAGDPEAHIGQLTNALLRNVRLLSAIGLHTKGMTLEQSRKMFLDAAYQDEGNAEQQAARGAYDPAYLNYTMGKLMIRRLRTDWCATRGGSDSKSCWTSFHDAFLSYGGPPIPLVRGAMMGEPPASVF